MDFLRFLLRRVIFGIVVLWLVTLGTFFLFFVIPNDPAALIAGKGGTPQRVAQIKARLGLDQPILEQYWHYMSRLLHGDLGTSFYTGVPVNGTIKADLPPTLSLIIGGAVLWLVAGIGVGVLSATRARSLLDRATTVFVLIGISMPTFVVGLLLLFVVYFQLAKHGFRDFAPGYIPFTQDPWQWFLHMILPWITLATVQAATYSRLTRGSLLDALGNDYIRTARSKGLRERRVIYRHGLRSALTPVVTQLGVDIGTLIGGAVVTESVFNLGGVGQALLRAFEFGDVYVILGIVILTAAAVVLANLAVDVAYSFLDPRVRLS
ncbi:MAG: ABC transporter permease [Micromonosporaceae bacterium]